MIRSGTCFALSLVLIGSAWADALPVTSEYFRTAGGGTAVETADGTRVAYFGIVLVPIKALPDGTVLAVEFENPEQPSQPLRLIYAPRPRERRIVLRSQTVSCVLNNRDYVATVKMYSDVDLKTLLSTHVQPFTFSMPDHTLRQLGIKECS